uniref:Reverse transcriptase domain-containing protein n=1 Tax=Tanacetum cinerariifolium TaxID=118510 RepID=A0A6L2JVN2_TANCI|nr:reverse transcriptase domain-containing protein [Tanacetum cinerariifolium]
MTGVMSYLHKHVEQPGPKVVYRDDSTCTTEGYSSIKCNGIVFTKVEFVNGLKLTHLNFKTINKLAKQNLVIGLPLLVYSKDKPCSPYEKESLIKKADDGYLLRYSLVSKAFRVFNTIRKQTEETYHITFDESLDDIKFSKPLVDDINIAKIERYPSNEYLYPYEPSQRFLYEEKPKRVFEALQHLGWVDAIQDEINQFARNKHRFIIDDPNIIMEEYIKLEEEKARRQGQTFNWQNATYGKMEYYKDDSFTNLKTEYPTIVLDDTSDAALSCEPTVSHLDNNEIDFNISFDEFDDEDYMVIFDENSFSCKIISVDNLKTNSKYENDKVNMPSYLSPEPTFGYIEGLDFFKDFENEFPTIAYNDLKSKSDTLFETSEMSEAGFGAYWSGSERVIPDTGDLMDYWMEISSNMDFLGPAPSYVFIQDPVRRLCHKMIGCSISGKGQAPEKVTDVDFFYLRSMDRGTANVPYLLAQYLFRHAEGRKSGARLSGGHFIGRLTSHFGLAAVAGAYGAAEDAPTDDEGAWAVPAPVQALSYRHSLPSTRLCHRGSRGLRRSGRTYQAFDSTFVGSSLVPYHRRTIDQAVGGKLHDKNAKESKALLEDLALCDNESWNDPRDFAKPVKAVSLPQDVSSTSDRCLIELKNRIQCLIEAYLAPKLSINRKIQIPIDQYPCQVEEKLTIKEVDGKTIMKLETKMIAKDGTISKFPGKFLGYTLSEEEEEASEKWPNYKLLSYAVSDSDSDLESMARNGPKCNELEDTLTNNVTNANANGGGGNGGNNRCSYKGFMACNPKEYDRKGGAIALTRWIEKMENARGREVVIGMSWANFKALLVEEFYPSNKIEKLENEFWNHKMVGANHAAYTYRFHELAKLVPHPVTPESSRIKSQFTKGNEKRKGVEETSKSGGSWKENKKAKVGTGFMATTPPRNEFVGSSSKCSKCYTYHPENGPCKLCYNYQKQGHFAKDFWAPFKQVAPVNAVMMGNNQRVSYECGSFNHLRNTCTKMNRASGQAGNPWALEGNRNT